MQNIQDRIYPEQLSNLSKKALLDCFVSIDSAHPLGQLWQEDAGQRWSGPGRLAWLWLTQIESPSNFATAVELLKQSNQAGNAWHESFDGMPDVVLMWLAHQRASKPHPGLATRLSSILHDAAAPIPMGEGVCGDGGWLDRALQWLHGACLRSPDPGRALVSGAVEQLYARLLRANLQASEDPYHVWGRNEHSTWSPSQSQALFERIVCDMELLGLDVLVALNTYPLLSACDTKFMASASPALLRHADKWLSRSVEQAFQDAGHPYRFPAVLVSRILSWPQVNFPECLVRLGDLPETLAYVEQAAPALAASIQHRYLEARVPPPVHAAKHAMPRL